MSFTSYTQNRLRITTIIDIAFIKMNGNNNFGNPGVGHSLVGNGHPSTSNPANTLYLGSYQTERHSRGVCSPEHYLPPHNSPSSPLLNRFAAWQESVIWKSLEDERADRKKIEEWDSTQRCWSGTGQKHVESKELAFPVDKPNATSRLGAGAYGVVDSITYGGVSMVRKKIDRQILKHPRTLDELREEAMFMERLKHRHIVTLIGTFTHDDNRFLNILTYPVAVCDLEQYLQDFEQLRAQKYENILNITERVRRLGFADLTPIQYQDPQLRSELLTSMGVRMMEMLGCVTDAMEYVHAENIKHQDLKPRNIVLSPGKVYITDFGISRVLHERASSVQDEHTVGYAPPEANFEVELHRPSAVDVYSLGGIFLNVVALAPGFPRARCKDVLSSRSEAREGEIAAIASEIACLLVRTGADDETHHTISQKHIMGLIKWMLVNDPDERPDMSTVNSQLHMLGGLDQIYHSSCCKRSTAWMAASLNENIRKWEAQIEKRYDEARLRFNRSLEEKQRVLDDKQRIVEENTKLKEEVEQLRSALRGPYMDRGTLSRSLENERAAIDANDFAECG